MEIDSWGYIYFVWILVLMGLLVFFFFFGLIGMEEGK